MAGTDKSRVLRELSRILSPVKGDSLTDGQLLEKYIANRDEGAFEALVHRHGGMVFSVCNRVLGHAQDAEDASQATFIVLAKKASACVPREAVGNWLYGIAYKVAQKARATSRRRNSREKQVDDLPEVAWEPDENWRELIPVLDRELNRLPDKFRLPIVLCELEGRTRREVAQQLKLSEGTLSSHLARARKMLSRRLSKYKPLLTGAAMGYLLSEGGATASAVKSTVSTALGKIAVPGRVTALAQGVIKAMFLAKLKAVSWALFLITTAGMSGAAALKYQKTTTERPPITKTVSSTVAEACLPQDVVESLRQEIAALRKEVLGMRERMQAFESKLSTLKSDRNIASEANSPMGPQQMQPPINRVRGQMNGQIPPASQTLDEKDLFYEMEEQQKQLRRLLSLQDGLLKERWDLEEKKKVEQEAFDREMSARRQREIEKLKQRLHENMMSREEVSLEIHKRQQRTKELENHKAQLLPDNIREKAGSR